MFKNELVILYIIAGLLIINILMLSRSRMKIEGMSVDVNPEALANLSTMYNNGKLKVSELEVTGKANITGDLNVQGTNTVLCGGKLRFTNHSDKTYIQSGNKAVVFSDMYSASASKLKEINFNRCKINETGEINAKGNIALNDKELRLRSLSDSNHSLKYHSSNNGPQLRGFDTIKLTQTSGSKQALQIDGKANINELTLKKIKSGNINKISSGWDPIYTDAGLAIVHRHNNKWQGMYLTSDSNSFRSLP
jgi:hypothetical protein